ncbi:MAG: GatB/YqeY domain-containing protein [Anaerolineales bacterium]
MENQKKIEQDLKTAIKSGDEVKKRTLRMVLSSIKLAEIDRGHPLSDEDVLGVLQKEIKSLRETISDAERAGRADLIEDTEPEIHILEEYLPQPLSDQQIEEIITQAIDQVGAVSIQDMGKVMKTIMPQIQGRAEGSRVSAVVRAKLMGE